MATVPSIACLGIIGKNNNPLHMTLFPSQPGPGALLTALQFQLLLSSTLDIFAARSRANSAAGAGLSGDFGLLHAIDERLAAYGFETNTGVRFVAVVDVMGRRLDVGGGNVPGNRGSGGGGAGGGVGAAGSVAGALGSPRLGAGAVAAAMGGEGERRTVGLREGEMKLVFKAMQTAYIRLLQNPFYEPDDHSPPLGGAGKYITSRRFAAEMRRIGDMWRPGLIG